MDTLFPFFVGHRTQILAGLVAIIQVLSWVGVVPTDVANRATEVLTPLAAATFAEKLQRNAVEPTPVVVVPPGTPEAPGTTPTA